MFKVGLLVSQKKDEILICTFEINFQTYASTKRSKNSKNGNLLGEKSYFEI